MAFLLYIMKAQSFSKLKAGFYVGFHFPLVRNPAARYPVVSHDAAMLNYTVPFTSPSNWTLPDHSNQQTNVQANFTATASAAPSGEPSPHPQHPYLNCGPAARRHCRALPGASGRPRTPRFEHDYFPPPIPSSLSLPLYKILATGFLISFLLRGWGVGEGSCRHPTSLAKPPLRPALRRHSGRQRRGDIQLPAVEQFCGCVDAVCAAGALTRAGAPRGWDLVPVQGAVDTRHAGPVPWRHRHLVCCQRVCGGGRDAFQEC